MILEKNVKSILSAFSVKKKSPILVLLIRQLVVGFGSLDLEHN